MSLAERDVQAIVDRVMNRLQPRGLSANADAPRTPGAGAPAAAKAVARGTGSDGVFDRMEDAIEAAEEAQRALVALPTSKRYEIVGAMRRAIVENVEELARMAVEETGMGRVEDKVRKNLAAALKTPGPEDLATTTWTGSNGLTLEEWCPYGVIGSVTPSTNPSETFANNGIAMISAGNAVVFNPHPSAKRVSLRAMTLMNRAILQAGGPPNLLTAIAEPTLETGLTLFAHPKIRVLVVTGGPAVVKRALASGKRVMAAGPGNPPVIVDLSADLDEAAENVQRGHSIDNNIICTAEKECFVVGDERRYQDFLAALGRHGGHRIAGHQLERLMKVAFTDYKGPMSGHCTVNRKMVGRNASVLAKAIDLSVPDSTRFLFAEVKDYRHPLVVSEQLMPVLPVVRAPDFDTAVKWAVEVEHGFKHTAVIHTKDLGNATRFARAIETSIFVVNGPNYAALGIDGEGPTAWTITTPTGEGCTRPSSFGRKRRLTVAGGALRIM